MHAGSGIFLARLESGCTILVFNLDYFSQPLNTLKSFGSIILIAVLLVTCMKKNEEVGEGPTPAHSPNQFNIHSRMSYADIFPKRNIYYVCSML